MKKVILFSLIWVAAMACHEKQQNVNPQTESVKTSIVPYRQLTTVPASGEELKVDLQEIADSRCPANVVCITMGSAQMKFIVSNAKSQTDVKVNFTGNSKESSQTFTLDGQTYELKVSEVLPYPVTRQSPKLDDYKVSLSIVKK
ncbi:hypothetical protein [Dyadobacter sediminis]|uniref:Lipoprotein n=1 Tax=Dyadobacter sediminis TaxID=1493691 RepID=A0A5R9KL06_9BACT|nr:hypothetical protein [Dyadobacter sediminis]TLU96895.1 hypothetical protein FEM55_07180 [Dyadobacter sediminis]GGB86049.1 hypothetical protein GCM10011325_12100 [Dyadobacter sediminis]